MRHQRMKLSGGAIHSSHEVISEVGGMPHCTACGWGMGSDGKPGSHLKKECPGFNDGIVGSAATVTLAPDKIDAALTFKQTEGEASHLDTGKPDMTLIDPGFLRELAKVLAFGAAKYGVENWRKGSSFRRYVASALRHQMAFLEKEDVDPESGCLHLAHATANLMFVLAWQRTAKGADDRLPPMVDPRQPSPEPQADLRNPPFAKQGPKGSL
jgi:hypothetical protein